MNKTNAHKATLAHLKAKAAKLGYEVEDDQVNGNLYVHAPAGKAWESGQLTSLMEGYGSSGSWTAAWRAEAIGSMMERLGEYPPTDLVPFQDYQ